MNRIMLIACLASYWVAMCLIAANDDNKKPDDPNPCKIPEGVLSIKDLDEPPKIIKMDLLKAPSAFDDSCKNYNAKVLFIINENGYVVDPCVRESTHVECNQKVLDAVMKWKFIPGKKNGKSVECYVVVPIHIK